MKRFLAILLPLALAGCDQEELREGHVNFAYAKPNNLGMYDPQATPAGTFYSWNTQTNRLTALGEVQLKPGTPSKPRKVFSNRLAGFGVEGLPIKDVSIVQAKIGGQFKATVSDSVRQKFYNPVTALRDYVIERKDEGATEADILDLFHPKDENYRTVIFVSEERSSSAQFHVGAREDEGKSVAKFKVELPGQEIVTVTADAVSSADCGAPDGGDDGRPVCFTDVKVYNPFIQGNGNLGWRIDDSFNQADLSEALRNL